jgi:hypothetical protein
MRNSGLSLEERRKLNPIGTIPHLLVRIINDYDHHECNMDIDVNYKSLNTVVTALDDRSEAYQLISRYITSMHYVIITIVVTNPSPNSMVMNTHAPSHYEFKLSIKHAFAVERKGAKMRFEPFKEMHNR